MLHVDSVEQVPRQVVLVHVQREPTLADAALLRDECEILSVHVPVSLSRRAWASRAMCWVFQCRLCGIRSPPHSPFAGLSTVPFGRLLGWWKPALSMLLATELMIRLTSVPVKGKACIYNNLRPVAGIGCIAGIGLHRRWPGRAKTDCRVSKSDMAIFRQSIVSDAANSKAFIDLPSHHDGRFCDDNSTIHDKPLFAGREKLWWLNQIQLRPCSPSR